MLSKLSSPVKDSRKVNLNKCCFEGGTSLNWNVFKPRLFAELKSKQAFDYVGVTAPGAIDEAGNPVERVPDFQRPCPAGEELNHVQAQLDSQINAVRETLVRNTDLINAIPAAQLNAAGKAQEILKATVKANDEITKINNSRGSVSKDLESSIALFEKRLENFEQRKADAIKTFYAMLGTGPLSIAEGHLRNGCPRAAFVALDTHFNAGVGGQQAAALVMTQLQNFTVDLEQGSLAEHAIALQQLADEWRAGDLNQPLSETFLLLSFLAAVERSTDAFKNEILYIRQNNLTWEMAMLKLQEKEATLTVEKSLGANRKKGIKGKLQDGSKNEIHSLLTKLVKKHVAKVRSGKTATGTVAAAAESPQKKSLPTCSKCGKRGHSAETCWSDLTCPQCKKKGHIPKFCPEITGKVLGSPKKPVNVSELLKK